MNNLALSGLWQPFLYMLLLIYCKEIPSLGVNLISKEYYSSVFESEVSIIKKDKKISMQMMFFS